METAPTPLVDIGVNLTNKRFHKDLDAVMESALDAGVSTMVITGTSVEESIKALALSQRYPENCFATAGVHPHDAKTVTEEGLSELKALYAEPKVVAVGETGLDFNRDFSPRPIQEKVFEQQLELAIEHQLPVFLHQRDAHERFIPILKQVRDQLPNAVLHCFTGSRKELFETLDLDLHIGITGWVCDERRGQELKAMVHNIPLERLMIETDSPYLLPRDLTPKPKSRRNEPRYLPHIANTLAGCYQMALQPFCHQVTSNSLLFFQLPDTNQGG